MTSVRVAAVRASAIGVAAYVVSVAAVLVTHGADPSWFVRFGVDAKQTQLGQQVLGSVITHPGVGADGQFFWILARDPLLLRPQGTRAWLDRPTYRAQRIAYPALAAPWRLFGERGLLWGLLLENISLVAIGSYFTARLAICSGLPARTALAFAFNPGVIFATMFDLADVLALAATVGALYAAVSRKHVALALFSAMAGLARESAALALGAAALIQGLGSAQDGLGSAQDGLGSAQDGLGSGQDGRPPLEGKTRALLIVPAVLAIGAWGGYVRIRFGFSSSGVVEFAPPLVGFLAAWQAHWAAGPIVETVSAVGLLIAAGAVVILFARRRTLLLSAALPYALMFPFLSQSVMLFANNAFRAFAPAFTFLWLEAYRRTPPRREGRVGGGGPG